MRGFFVALILLLALGGSAFYFFRFRRETPRSPTAVGWRASIGTLAGDGSPAIRDDAQPARAAFAAPFGLAVGAGGTIYVSDGGESNRIRKIAPDGAVTTFAGGVEGDADGVGAAASFNTPSGLALDAEGNVYVADTGNNRIRKVTPEGQVTTLAGDGTAGYADGPAAQARFDAPVGVAVGKDGALLVTDDGSGTIWRVAYTGKK